MDINVLSFINVFLKIVLMVKKISKTKLRLSNVDHAVVIQGYMGFYTI